MNRAAAVGPQGVYQAHRVAWSILILVGAVINADGSRVARHSCDPAARTPPRSDVPSGRAADARGEPRVEASAANHDQPAGAERQIHWVVGVASVWGRWHRRRGRRALDNAN